jgi:hypothetical protein
VSPANVIAGDRVRIEGPVPGSSSLIRIRDGVEAGTLAVVADGDTLFVERLCIESEHRGYGLGTETARLVRRHAEGGPWRLLRAWAPPDLGLAVYFWCRMGLRPVPGEGPHGGILFERTVG